MSDVKAVRAVVRGRVQGVGFRFATVEEARRRGVTGWVRNLPAGRVEVLAQGPESAVESLVTWLAEGPRLALVVGVELASAEPDADLVSFQVRF
jgi:acylphosphatase